MATWNVIVCTCQNRESADSFRRELLTRQQKGLLCSNAAILAVDDPKPNIGSGSATLNALLCVSEYLAAQEGHKVVSGDVLYNARVLILLLGTTFPFSPCGHAFMPVQQGTTGGEEREGVWSEQTEIKSNIDQLMSLLDQLCQNSPPGVWISSTDMLLTVPKTLAPVDVIGFDDTIAALTVLAKPKHAMLHGACRITDTGEFAQIIHLGGEELVKQCIRPDGMCDMLTGIVYMSPRVSEAMLALHIIPPLDACTYAGLDNGAPPLSLSLFFDILLCLTTEIAHDSYVAGTFKPATSTEPPSTEGAAVDDVISYRQRGRAALWKALRLKGLKLKAVSLPGVEHHYLKLVAVDVLTRYQQMEGVSLINSIVSNNEQIGNGSVLINCNIKAPLKIGNNCFLSGLGDSFFGFQATRYLTLPLTIPDKLTVQEIDVALGSGRMRAKHQVVVVYGVTDDLTMPYETAGATFCNHPWSELFERTGIQPSELWLPNTPPNLLHARLFVVSHTHLEVGVQETFWLVGNGRNNGDPEILSRWLSAWRVSLADILRCVDCDAEFAKMRSISFELQRQRMIAALKENQPVCFLPFFKESLVEKRELDILRTLDEVAGEMTDPLVVCRIYACIADMLAYIAGETGLRAGPAANMSWRTAFALLEEGNIQAATKALAAERLNWMGGGPDRIIRASRHYERAGQILTRKVVASARTYINGVPCSPPAIGQLVTVTAPARVDLAGGWTDTPPQAYEWGGAVVTLALTINNEHPIKAVAERISEPKLVLVSCSKDGTVRDQLELRELSHLADYSQPHAPGALLKAAFICAGIVVFPSSQSLKSQLMEKYSCGFRLQTTSNVPQGSGLGTSSVLGGVIMAALWRAAGQEHTHDSLIHAVLHLEQLLTTGGGWQDQCGGLYGGAKLSQSQKGLPVKITTKQIQTPPGFMDKLSQHLLLVYTGKTRLARNLLQDVLRNWHSREAKIVQNMQDLVDNAFLAESAIERGDLAELGACLSRYQQHKLVMAPGSVPKMVAIFLEKIKDHIHGCSLAGAGGGGFLTVILKEGEDCSNIETVIQNNPELNDFVVYDAAVDKNGLKYSYD